MVEHFEGETGVVPVRQQESDTGVVPKLEVV
jgi:hypothetical protein